MVAFWTLALSMAAVAALCVLTPLFFPPRGRNPGARQAVNIALFRERLAELAAARDQREVTPDEFAEMELEARRELLNDADRDFPEAAGSGIPLRAGLLAAAALVPLVAILLYADFGLSRGAIRDHQLTEQLTNTPPDHPDYRRLVSKFERFADSQGPQGRYSSLFLLAGAYLNLGDINKAEDAYAELAAQFPEDPGLASHHAQVLFIAADRRMTDGVRAAVDRALLLNPRDGRMMEIYAIAAMLEGDDELALSWFRRALATDIDSDRARLIRQTMNRLGISSEAAEGKAGFRRAIEVTVTAGEEVTLPGSSAVFVYARAASGKGVPLAARRLTLEALPASIRLDEAMAMIPGKGLASVDDVIVVARVSSTGNVGAAPGDFEARSEVIDLTKPVAPLTLSISDRAGSD